MCLGFFAVAGIILIVSAACGRWNPIFGGALSPPGLLNYLGMLAAVPIAALVATMPARALGASWKRALIGAVTITLALCWAFFGSGSSTLALVAAVLAPVAMVVAGCLGNNLSDSGATAVFVSSATLLVVAYLVTEPGEATGFVVTVPAWVILPVVAGLFLPEDRES